MTRRRPEWLKPTPREEYATGREHAAIYQRAGTETTLPDPRQLPRKARPYWAGRIAEMFGVDLQPPGRDRKEPEPQPTCGCGFPLPPGVGKYGCPNCCGDEA